MGRSKEWACVSIVLGLGLFFIQASANAADYGRIKDPNNLSEREKAISRCGDVPLPAPECEQGRQDAVRMGCVTQDEANKLKEWGLSPTCIAGKYRGWCACGCFHPLTLIGVMGLPWPTMKAAGEIAKDPQRYTVLHLGKNTSLGSFEYGADPISFATSGLEVKPLVVIETRDGRVLKLTTQHAIMTAQGEMIQAKNLTPETLLLDKSGTVVELSAIKTEAFREEVVNFRLAVKEPLEHVIFAEGLAVGDQAWQSTLEDLQNQILVRQ
jgi:hypothetical protein